MQSKALKYAHAQRKNYLAQFFDYLAIPSISAQPPHHADVLRAADWLRDDLAAIGLDAKIIPTAGNPLVYAEWLKKPGAPTVLIYGHYDVQPPEPFELWTSEPFKATIRDGAIYARGADDNKGQHFAHAKAIESYLKGAGELPVNVKFIAEGEEEIGGNSLADFVHANKSMLACDCVMVSDGSLYSITQPSIAYGLRGMAAFELTVKALARDVHSGHYGGNVQNPALALAQILAALKDTEGRITVPGFYEDVRVLSPEERSRYHT
jgi:acetylornithine deacetylase/succinyl-diaminopimelate desuccinylase-like protein